MSLRDDMELIIAKYKALSPAFKHNGVLIDIFEGNLLSHVTSDLKREFHEKSYVSLEPRIAPINLLKKIIEKTSGIFTPKPIRRIVGDSRDEELFAWYLENIDVNRQMRLIAQMYAMCKSTLVQPYVFRGKPNFRAVQNSNYFVIADDLIEDMSPTHVVLFCVEHRQGREVVVFTAFTDDEMLIFDEDQNIDYEKMAAFENYDGINPVRQIPFGYATSSAFSINPPPDTDILRMTKLVSVLLSDLNYSVKYQCFSMLYGIDIDDVNITMAPNALIRINSTPGSENKPEFGMIKPTVDYDGALNTLQTQLSLWLNSRGIRPGAIGTLSGDNFANGVSKMIDEMDTFEAREWLADAMAKLEESVWELMIHRMHPYWAGAGKLDTGGQLFSPGAKVDVIYAEQKPMRSRSQLVSEERSEIEARFTTRRRALLRLNPHMSEAEIDELIAEIDAERADPDAVFAAGRTELDEREDAEGESAS